MSAGADVRVSDEAHSEKLREIVEPRGLVAAVLAADRRRQQAEAELDNLRQQLAAAQEQAAQAERAGMERAAKIAQSFAARHHPIEIADAIRAAIPADPFASVPVNEGVERG